MKTLFIFLLSIISISTYGQTASALPPPANWKMPTNIEGICKNTESFLVQLYKAEQDNAKDALNPQLTDVQRREAWTLVEASKTSQRLNEDRWNKLGCIHYMKK